MRYILLSTVIVLAALVTAPSPQSAHVISYPEGYRQWTHVKTTFIGANSTSFARNGGFHHFYANSEAMEGYRSGVFPDGSVLVDDGIAAMERAGEQVEGARRRLAVMVKDSRAFAASGGWGFESFTGDARVGTLSESGKAACLACHQQAQRDLVFSQFRN